MGEGEVEKTLHQLSPFFASIFLLFPRNAWYSGYFYFPDSSQISAMVGDHSRQIENSNLYRRGRRRWISHITNPLNCWAPVPLSRKFQFLAHFPFPAKFIGRIPRGGGGVLGISSDGDDRRIFLGLKFSIPGFFWVRKFGKYFFG